MRTHSCWTLGLLVLAGACGGMRSSSPSLSPTAADADARTRAAAETRNRFLQAFAERDSVLLVSFLAPAFELVTVEGDTIQGAAAAAARLLALGAAEPNPLRLYGGTIEACVGSELFEHDAGFTGPAAPGAPVGTFRQGTFVALWTESSGAVRARRLELSAKRRSGPPPADCRLEYVSASPAQGFIASLALETTPLRPTRGIEAVSSALVAQGYNFAPADPQYESFPQVRTGTGGLTAGFRYRAHPSWSAELQAGIRLREQAEGVNATEQRRVVIKSHPITATTLLQFHRGILRLGAGPSLLLPNFTVTETNQRVHYSNGYPEWTTVSDERNTSSALSPAAGIAGEVAIALPMARRSLTELRVGWAGYGRSTVPGTPYFAGAEVSNSVASLAVAVGLGW